MHTLTVAILIATILQLSTGFHIGAPYGKCIDGYPLHSGHTAKPVSESPFTIAVSANTYTPGNTITVTVSGYKIYGFLLRVFRASGNQNELIGSFTSYDADKVTGYSYSASSPTVKNCLTHNDEYELETLTVDWVSPSQSAGDVLVTATLIKTYSEFYVGVTAAITANVPEASPPAAPVSSLTVKPSFDGCGDTVGCMVYPSCSGSSCRYAVSYSYDESTDMVDFAMMAAEGDEYISFGLSGDEKMGNDETMTCIASEDGVLDVQHGQNQKHPELFNSVMDGSLLENKQVALIDGRLYCTFTRPAHLTYTLYDPENYGPTSVNISEPDYHGFIASGKTYTGAKAIKKHKRLPIVSGKLDFKKTDKVVGEALPFLLKVHGVLGIDAFLLVAIAGIVIMRNYRKVLVKMCCKTPQFFTIHRVAMIASVILVALSVLLSFLQRGGWSYSMTVHGVFGIILLTMMLFNFINAYVRPDPGAENRNIFNWVHRIAGVSAFVIGIVTMFTGMCGSLMDVDISRKQTIITSVWIVWLTIWATIMEILRWKLDAYWGKENGGGPDDFGGGTSKTADGTTVQEAEPPKPPIYAKLLLPCMGIMMLGCFIFLIMTILTLIKEM